MATIQNAKTQYVKTADGINLAYRRLGRTYGIPLVMHIHFRGNMEFWDPALVDRLAESRPVIIFDNSGIGKSGGEVATTFKGWANNVIALVKALNIPKIDLLGFSMGGYTAQMAALNAPELVRKLILAGTGPSNGPKLVRADQKYLKALKEGMTPSEVQEALAYTFFPPTDEGRAAAKEYWKRTYLRPRAEDRIGLLDAADTARQVEAVKDWTVENRENSYHRLHELKMPVLIANGNDDLLIPTVNSWHMRNSIPNAQLIIYPNAGHGFLFQCASLFAAHVDLFLDGPSRTEKGSVL